MSEKAMADLKLPFPQSWWIDPGEVIGGCYPGTLDPAESERMLDALLERGVRTVVNLQAEDERGRSGKSFPDYTATLRGLARRRGVEVRIRRFPIVDMGTTDEARMQDIIAAVRAGLAEGGLVYVHCWVGHGRTGTVGGCWLVEQGVQPERVFAVMRAARWHDPKLTKENAPQTPDQVKFVQDWAPRQPAEVVEHTSARA